MDEKQLAAWAPRARPELSEAVAADIRDHFTAIPSRGDVYGYAILPGDPTTSTHGIGPLVAAYNRTGDIGVGPDEREFAYYKYCVDEWQHRDQGRFPRSDSVLASLNARFAAAHRTDADDFEIDATETAFARSLLNAILDGVATAKAAGLFGQGLEYLAIWVSDSNHPILEESVCRLNPSAVVEEFLGEFGSAG